MHAEWKELCFFPAVRTFMQILVISLCGEINMALVPIKTASETGYCDCVCGCYELASVRDEDTGKGYCPACGKDHLELNAGVGLNNPAPIKIEANAPPAHPLRPLLPSADPPARLR